MRISRHRRYYANRNQVASPGSQYKYNEKILAPEVMVIDADGSNLGAMTKAAAIEVALARELDLVEVFPAAKPPVCKILDYSAFKYQKEKEAKKQKAKQVDVKGIRLSPRIGDHDIEIRIKQAAGFLEEGHKVKLELPLRGRERQFADLARGVINGFVASLNEKIPCKTEGSIEKQDNRLTLIVAKR
ncbi:MAG: translation initiation factor IF-3 [bacterium]